MIVLDLIDFLQKSIPDVKRVFLERLIEGIAVDNFPCINVQLDNETLERPGGQFNFYDNEIDVALQVVTDNKKIELNIAICEKLKTVLAGYETEKGYRLDSVTVERRPDKYIRTLAFIMKQIVKEN